MKTSHLLLLSATVCFISLVSPSRAGTAVFSEDGKTIYLADDALKMLDLAKPDRLEKITTS